MRKSKVLLMDEATSSIDDTTCQLIQATIREQFADCTVITIAHRIQTVVNCCSKVIVIKDGRVVEEGEPETLLKQADSLFAQMASAHTYA